MDLYRLRKRKMIRYNENLYQKFVLIFITEVEVTKYITKKKKNTIRKFTMSRQHTNIVHRN